MKKELADSLSLKYAMIAAGVTVHSSLQVAGLTAAFSSVLSDKGISCSVVAAFVHDHIDELVRKNYFTVVE